MNARGSTEVIVASIGLGMGALTQNLYTMIVTVAVLTTMAMPPMLRGALRRLPMDAAEKERLEREELDARGFVSRFERLLIAADESRNGRFASRLAGFIAGQRGMPITVLQLEERKHAGEGEKLKAEAIEGAKEARRAVEEENREEQPEKISIGVATPQATPVEVAIAQEAEKGYDVLFVGVDRMRNADGTFSANVDRAAQGFEGPLVLTLAGNNAGLAAASDASLNVLLPVVGTEVSRRGAELAFALTPARQSRFVALHAAQRGSGESGRPATRSRPRRKAEKSMLDDIGALAKRYGHDRIEVAVRGDLAADVAILEEARRSKADLIVIGAGRRVGDSLFLGDTVTSVLRQWKGAIVLVAM